MPNGRSGSLFVDKDELARWLDSVDNAQIVGRSLASTSAGRCSDVSAEAVSAILAEYPTERVVVEEQDGICYVLHLYYPLSKQPPDLEKWILVGSASPL